MFLLYTFLTFFGFERGEVVLLLVRMLLALVTWENFRTGVLEDITRLLVPGCGLWGLEDCPA